MSLLQLYPDPNIRPELRGAVIERIDFIAVPGVSSTDASIERNALDTFTASTDNGRTINWLQDRELLPHVVPHSRVLLYCYNAFNFFNFFSWHTLLGLSENFLNVVLDSRKDDPHRPIIFIAHSLGGIVIKHALYLASCNPKFASIKNSTEGIIFFGTPHRGILPESSLESIVTTVLQRLFFRKPSWKRYGEELNLRCNSLPVRSNLCYNSLSNTSDASLSSTLSIVSFHESIGLVVPKWNATLGLPGEVVSSLHASHRDLCRYESPQDLNYKIVEDALLSLVEKALLSNPGRKDLDYSDAQVLRRLSSPALSVPRYRITKNLPGTSEWLLSHPVFSRWKSSRETSIVWIIGIAGSGKSTLARFVVDTLQNSSTCAYKFLSDSGEVQSNALEVRAPRVISFFCSYVDPPSNAMAVLRSLLHQLLTAQPSLLRYISPDDRLQCGQQTAQASLLGGLLALVAEYVDIIVVIDALDELDDPVRDDLLAALTSAPKLSRLWNISHQVHSYPRHSSLKILCTSRPEGYQERPMELSAYTINLSRGEAAESIHHDIHLYIKAKLDRYPRQTLLRDSQKAAIEKILVEKAEGMFLWVKLQLETLFALTQESHDIFSVLAHLPRGLENSYSRALEAIQRQSSDFADVSLRILKWLLHAKRPLHASELSDAVAFKTDHHLPRYLSQGHPRISNTLDSLCGGLVEIDEYDSTVQFIHRSVRDFLQGYFDTKVLSPNEEVGRAHRSLAQVCLSYLAFKEFDDFEVRCAKGRNLRNQNLNGWPTIPAELFRRFPFLGYASIFWSKHIGSISAKHDDFSASEVGDLVHILSNPKSAPFRIWFPIYWLSHCTETWEHRRYPEYPTKLIVLAFLGYETEIRYLLRWREDIVDECTPAGEEWTPLMAAAWMGNESVVDLLLEYHAGDKADPEQNARTLVQAIERGYITIAQKLIGRFTKVQSSLPSKRSILDIPIGEEGVTPLIASVRSGSRELVTMCLSLGADPNARGFRPYSGLLASGILLLEIELALPVTPLGAAISTGSIDMSRILLHSGADIITSNAIFVAARTSNDGLLKLLLNNGADVNTNYDQNEDGRTPLHYAALYGSRNIVEQLLSHGAEVDSTDKFGWTPFQLACGSGKFEVARTLLKKSTQSSISKNPALLCACSLANYELVKLLLGAGASPRATGTHNRKSALDCLFDADDVLPRRAPRNCVTSKLPHQGSRVAVLELLLHQGADLRRRDTFGNTYIQLAVYRRWPKVVNALLKSSKIDIDHRNNRGETAIDIVAQFGDQDLCQTFIHHGATVWQATLQNVLNSGSQAGVTCLIKEIKGPNRPHPKRSMRPYFSDSHQPLTCHSLPKYKTLVDPMGFSGGKFKKVTNFLALRNIENLETITLTTENNFSFGNTVKSWIEDHSGTPWNWWPLSPRLHSLKPSEVWLEWLCRGGTTHQEKISSELAQDIEQLLDFQRELSKIDTSEKSWESHQKTALDPLFKEIESAGADGHGSIASSTAQQSVPRPTPSCSQIYRINPFYLNPGAQGSRQSARRPPSNPSPQPPRSVNVRPSCASFQAPGRQSGATRPSRRYQRPVPPALAPNVSLSSGLYVLFKVGKNPITHIDAIIHNTDPLFFSELKRVYKCERGWLRERFSIWRYHHCNFDKYIRSWDNLVSAQSTGTRTSNFLPDPPNDIDYEFVRGTCAHGEAPISQLEFRNMYRTCSRLCWWWLRLTHQCNAPANIYSLSSPLCRPTDASLQLIPKRKVKWDMFENCRGEAWGLTAVELPSFIGFLVYLFLSAIGPAVFWGLWLSIWGHAADLQNASIPAAVTLTLWALLWQCAGGKWNADRQLE